MIDKQKREKIIQLWRDGETKAAIQRKTGVSQPTIRKIIRKIEDEEKTNDKEPSIEKDNFYDDRIPELENKTYKSKKELNIQREVKKHQNLTQLQDLTFIINSTVNYPWRDNDPWTIMRNGIAIWNLSQILNKVIEPKAAEIIVTQIKNFGDTQNFFEVQIINTKTGYKRILVNPLIKASV